MKDDIKTREDLYILVSKFYEKLLNDELLVHFFEEFENPTLLEKHLNILVDFWDNILFYSGTYQKNAMKPHLKLHLQKPFQKEHFKQWLFHFNTTVDELFQGNNAHTLKTRAQSIATVMEIKIYELK